jgi:hypothetical protein
MAAAFVAATKLTSVAQLLKEIRDSHRDVHGFSYICVLDN